MKRVFDGVCVSAVTAALPAQSLTLTDFGELFGTKEVMRIVASTGIEAVRIAGSLKISDLCEAAARRLLEETATDIDEIDAIVVVTQTPDDLMPGVAVKLHACLGMPQESMAFDLNYGCSGYIYGLTQAALLITGAKCRKVLLCTGDVTSKIINPQDRPVRLVFGDGASATLVTAGTGQFDVIIRTDGSGRASLCTPLNYSDGQNGTSANVGHLHMDGAEVMNFALSKVPVLINDLLAATGLERGDIDLLALHQANRFMLNYLRKMTGLAADRVPIDIAETGNTGPSSIPLLLARQKSTPVSPWENAIVCGFGVGLSWGAIRLDLSETRLIAPIDVVPKTEATPPQYCSMSA